MNIRNIFEDHEMVEAKKQPHFHKQYYELSETFKAKTLGFHVTVIDPKNFSYPYHYHEKEEELFLVLEGEAIARCNNKFYKIKAGDLIFYPTGPEFAHSLYNHTDKPVKLLALSNISPEYDTCHYPDSKKKSSENGYLQNGQVVGYYKDEEDPKKYWPEPILRGEV